MSSLSQKNLIMIPKFEVEQKTKINRLARSVRANDTMTFKYYAKNYDIRFDPYRVLLKKDFSYLEVHKLKRNFIK